MRLRFAKMHGLGNDFMIVDLVTQHAEFTRDRIRELADRHTGVGFDQLLLVEPPRDPDADFRYRIFNADGSEAEQCGNGARCFARFVHAEGLSPKAELRLETTTGPVTTRLCENGDVEVDLGVPRTAPHEVPFLADAAAACYSLEVDGRTVEVTVVSIGNPHAVVFVPSVFDAPVATLGAAIGGHPRFPEGVNVGFCQVIDASFARLRVFERGAGETRACGSGACAAAVAGYLTGRLGGRCKISLPGGKLRTRWAGPGAPVYLSGPATFVFDGEVEL
jgi:diaminopimelate epimerase